MSGVGKGAPLSRAAREGFAGCCSVEPQGLLQGFPGYPPPRVLLHGCAGAIRGIAAWMSWGNPKGVLLDGFLEVLLGGCRRELGKGLQSGDPGSAACVPGESQGRVW